MATRLLVLSASVGAGHIRAAEAVELACRRFFPEVEVESRDVLDFTSSMFRRFYAQSYLELVGRAPHIVGYLYDWLDQTNRTGRNISDRLRQALQKVNLRKFTRFLTSGSWNVVVNTHFLPAEIVADMRTRGVIDLPQVTVCTDFETHRLWVNQPCEQFFTATNEGACYLEHWGIPKDKIEVTGIPIDPAFSEPIDRLAVRKKFELDPDRPVVLQMCGGFGLGPVEQIANHLLESEVPIQLVVICGKNEKLKTRVERLPCPPRHRLLPVGFTREMHAYMAAADLLVSKPGGLTTSEALACGLPIVVVNPIPGQESRNSDYLLENGAAIKVNHPVLLRAKFARLLKEPGAMERMAQAARRLGKPDAAKVVVAHALEAAR